LESKNELKRPTDTFQQKAQPNVLLKKTNRLIKQSNGHQLSVTPSSSNTKSMDQKTQQENHINDLNLNHHLQATNGHFANYQAMFSPSANMLAAAAAAALAYPPPQAMPTSSNKSANFASSPFMTYMQQPFNNAAALAAYTSYLNSKADYPAFNSYNASNLNINSLNNMA
jgi:hypothetical protein